MIAQEKKTLAKLNKRYTPTDKNLAMAIGKKGNDGSMPDITKENMDEFVKNNSGRFNDSLNKWL